MRLLLDLSAILWNTALASKDPEGTTVIHDEKPVVIPSFGYCYENAINSICSYMREANAQPIDTILGVEGTNSKAPRLMIYAGYKQGRDKAKEMYDVFAQVRDAVVNTMRGLGSIAVMQNNCEFDDTAAWFAQNTRKDMTIGTVDNDLAVLNGTNIHGANIIVSVAHEQARNKYGDFPFRYITLYKAMVGDAGDKIGGIKNFGPAKWIDFHAEFGEDGMAEMTRLAELGSLAELADEATQNKMVARIYEGRDEFLRSYKLAKLHPEWVNGPSDPLVWMPGFVRPLAQPDERLKPFQAAMRLITADNYDQARVFLRSQVARTPQFALDLETSTPDESDDWLNAREAENKVDVIASGITGGSITFGPNMQYAFYMSVDHADTNNITKAQFAEMIQEIPKEKITFAHNAQGFELPVMKNDLGAYFSLDNGWRGFFPNMLDTRIMASWWDENQFQFGLKPLVKLHFDYDQVTYQELTGGRKMNELTGAETLHYGCDDVYTSGGMAVFYMLFMELEGTWEDFVNIEQKPMYLQARAYLRGVPIDMRRLSELKSKDYTTRDGLRQTLDQFLIDKGWEGSAPPVIDEVDNMSAAEIKKVVQLSCGVELNTQVRKVDRLTALMREAYGQTPGITTLADLLDARDAKGVRQFVSSRFSAAPIFNIGSPKQISELLYNVCELPVRLRGKVTPTMREKGIREGNPRTDDAAINMAVSLGDAKDDVTAAALKALNELKSIQTRANLYWEAYPLMIHWMTGKIHPSLKQSGTNTRRYSASDPNIQQLQGSYGGVRSVILPHHPNAIIASLDESAQELRQLADYCRDETMLSCYLGTAAQLRDIHSIVGARIAGCTYNEFRARYKIEDKEIALDEDKKTYPTLYQPMRQKAKITIFSLVYGAAAPKIAETLGITPEEAQSYIDAIFEMFPGILAWKEATEAFARTHGYVPIHGGGFRHLSSLINSEDKQTAAKAMRQAGNSRIQASGGNQIKRIMGRIWDSRLLDDYDYEFYFTVHDESVHSMDKAQAPEILKILHGFMTEQYLDIVPSASSIGIGKSFGTLKELGEVYDADKIREAVNDLFAEKAA